jgi:hypothetical protein
MFYVTPQGTHRHTTWTCARTHQPVGAPDPVRVSEQIAVTGYVACSECCTAADVKASEAASTAKANAKCTGNLVPDNPRKLYRKCECGYEGKVGRNGLRAHTPKNATKEN